MQARGFDGELRYLPGPPIQRGAIVLSVLAVVALVAFELAAHVAVPRL
jgi:hypothetical protein